MGIGYHFYDVHPKVLLTFDKRRTLVNAWNRIIKWWPDDEIRMRFTETNDSFLFVLYNQSRILNTTWVFLKHLKTSENYLKFKEDCKGIANFGLALYIPKKDLYELEIFKYKKRIADVKFLNSSEIYQDFIVLKSKEYLPSFSDK
jgi:hypothetical protein